jgi:2-methylisocitrate lyase-like PEP mutase family enzyme
MISIEDRQATFRALHDAGTFVIPNPWDIGSARLLEAQGFQALATTSGGFAATLGRQDMSVTRDLLLAHVEAMAPATSLPLNVDAERCFGDDAVGVTRTVVLLAKAGASGISIEDWNPETNAIDPIDVATERVAAAATAAKEHGVILTARCENLLHDITDIDDTIARLCAYRDAGAEVLYAPGLMDPAMITQVGAEVRVPMNVLLLPNGPSVAALTALGVRRISTGTSLARIAMGAFVAAAQNLMSGGSYAADAPFLSRDLARQAFR